MEWETSIEWYLARKAERKQAEQKKHLLERLRALSQRNTRRMPRARWVSVPRVTTA